MGYGITSESQIIDVNAISAGCQKIRDAAMKFITSAEKVKSASDTCSPQVLSIDNTTMQPRLDADAEYILSITKAIESFTMQIESVAMQIYRAQYNELAEYKQRLAAEQQNNNG